MALRKNGKKNRRGTKKGDKIHGQRKGKKGEAAQYITRAQAMSKLQVSLADFRKLCILKGIYPRDPKKKSQGLDKTYYHLKDIAFLAHEPILNKFFELKTFMKKFKRLMGRGERDLAEGLESRKPDYTLHHLVRERYPSFDDAVRDMDDALSMLALFQALSGDQRRGIPVAAINEATRLYQEFQLYVIRAQALRKVFASVKGYYFQAEIGGQSVTWLAPHQFAQELPPEVDFRVMLTFLEFYRAMVKFVSFRLYADLGLAYPPKRSALRDERSAEIAALEVDMREAGRAREAQALQGEREDAEVATGAAADFGQSEEAAELQRQLAAASRMKTTFRGLRVFVGREVPLRPVYFTLLCGGVAEVGWERGASAGGSAGLGSAFPAESEKITHQVVDRPPEHLELRPGREYVQPQWVLDSFNLGCLLPVAAYAPGRAPPPHLSPFVDDSAEGYMPRQREILNQFAVQAAGATGSGAQAAAEAGDGGQAGKEGGGSAGSSGQGVFEQFSAELRAEARGVWHSDFRERPEGAAAEAGEGRPEAAAAAAAAGAPAGEAREAPAPRPTEAEEERLRAKALMPKKHKRLLQRIETSAQRKSDATASLVKKRRQLEASGAAG